MCVEQEQEERGKRQVLVLGLDGAGKSSILQGLTAGDGGKRGHCRPTRGFNFMSLSAPACQLDFLESKLCSLHTTRILHMLAGQFNWPVRLHTECFKAVL